MKFTIYKCVCDKCKKEVQLVGGQNLPANWSLIASSNAREHTQESQNYPSSASMNYATVCDSCHSLLFGDFWSMTMSTNGGPDYVSRL